MKLSLVMIAVMTSAVSATESYNIDFTPCQGAVDPSPRSITIDRATLTDIGRIIQGPACQFTLTGISPGARGSFLLCMTYSDGNDGSTYLFKTGARKTDIGIPIPSEPFKGIHCQS